MAEGVCPTCGKPMGERAHMCAVTADAQKAYVCEHCGRTDSDPRHVCFPKLAKAKFSCGRCGRQAAWADALCEPKSVEGSGAPKEPKGKD
jgi:predicted RNA-binding Zn-ribbon protein involved in translation (DUF1610 family)